MKNMFKVNNRGTRHRSGVFIVNFKYIWHIVFFGDFEHVNDGWDILLPHPTRCPQNTFPEP